MGRPLVFLLALLAPVTAWAGPRVLDDFADAAAAEAEWRCADWATASQGGRAHVAGRTLQVPLRFHGGRYEQGYVGRAAHESFAGAGTLELVVRLPAHAPRGLRAKLILLLGEPGRWCEGERATALVPGAAVTARLELAGDLKPAPARELLAAVRGYGLKVEADDAVFLGEVTIEEVRLQQRAAPAITQGIARSVGVFGGYGQDVPKDDGYLCFQAGTSLSPHALRWPRLLPKNEDYVLGAASFGGLGLAGTPQVLDWTTLRITGNRYGLGGRDRVTATLSRAFPAVRYRTEGSSFAWESDQGGRQPASRLAVVLDGRPTVFDLARGRVDLSRQSEPWALLWAGGARGWAWETPVLLTFQRRPRRAAPGSSGVRFDFDGAAGAVNVMPLYGLRRLPLADTSAWSGGLPGPVLHQCRRYVSVLAAFPVACRETARVSAEGVEVSDAYTYEPQSDDWGTRPTPVAPLPPVVCVALDHGYPISIQGQRVRGDVATFYGPFDWVPGEQARYTLPRPAGIDRLPVALRVEGDPQAAGVREEMERLLRERTPTQPATAFIDGNDRAACFLAEAYPTLAQDSPLREKAREVAPRLVEYGYREGSLQELTEPVTGQRYLNNAKYWASKEPFDKEWYTGRQLAALCTVAETFDLDLARGVWGRALGLYRYFQIFFDWATGSTLSSVYGWTALIDGIHFAWEGMIGVARLARATGDRATFEDATYRAARQQTALYAMWFMAAWVRDLDYGVSHTENAKVPAGEVETRGSIDGFVESCGVTTLGFEAFWQTTNAIFWDNRPQFSFYRDYGLDARLRTIEYQVMPALHPRWEDGNAKEPAGQGWYYGSSYTAAHLVARALLFHDELDPLFAVYQRNKGTAVEKEWYSMFGFGTAGPTLLAIERAKAPLVETPASLRVLEASWDRTTGELSLEVEALRGGDHALRWREPGGDYQTASLSLARGARQRVRLDARARRGMTGALLGR
ncbi:MAG: hypothetical protein AB7N76_02015 [Planctomycetota bacterium]